MFTNTYDKSVLINHVMHTIHNEIATSSFEDSDKKTTTTA